jgi:hypothetical protein
MNAVLPFDGFLEVLRAKGFAAGLREHFALASLLQRWDGTNRVEFRNALAALVGRNETEVEGIRRLFDEFYTDVENTLPQGLAQLAAPEEPAEPSAPAPGQEIGPSSPPRAARRFPLRWAVLVLTVVVVTVVVSSLVVWWRGSTPRTVPVPTPAAAPAAPAVAPSAPVLLTSAPAPFVDSSPPPIEPRPALPTPPSPRDPRSVAAAVGLASVAVLAVFWRIKSVETRRRWLRTAWAAARSALPGPHYFRVVVRGRRAGLPRSEVEDAATLLGRAFASDAPARELDVPRSIRLAARRGFLPRFVFKPRRMAPAVLVFEDVSQDMEVWRAKVSTFLADLVRQGIALERYTFDGDLRQVADRLRHAPVRFHLLMRRRPDAPVLVISTGSGIGAVLDQSDRQWLLELENRSRRAWLTPVTDVRMWPDALRDLPIHVWPMTRKGLTLAARDLAGIADEPTPALMQDVAVEGRVTLDGIERMKRLASLVPHPTVDLLDALRVRFAPDVSDAVLMHLFADTETQVSPVLRLSDDEVRRCVSAVREETPRLEAAVRAAIVEALSDSRPPDGSAAHIRWEATLALQELALADLEGGDVGGPLSQVQTLARGPMWEEIRRTAHLVPETPTLEGRLETALGTGQAGPADAGEPPPGVKPPEGSGRPPRSWPGLRELAPAAVAASLVFVVGQQLQLFPTRTLAHVQDAYRLGYYPASDGAGGRLLVQKGDGNQSELPEFVDLYQGQRIFQQRLAVSGRSGKDTSGISLSPEDVGKYYQARAHLAGGNLALSNALWVPKEVQAPVLIDASPWALVTISGASVLVPEMPTPIVWALPPGSYHLKFENRGLQLTMERDIKVGWQSSTQVFRFVMPGFDAAATAAALAGRER